MEHEVEVKQFQIIARMKELKRRLEAGDESELLVWVLPKALACAQRPLRHHPLYGLSGTLIPADAKPLILDWISKMKTFGIVSIISFMHERDLGCYRQIDFGGLDLTKFLEQEGFAVCPLPWEDPAHSKTKPVIKRRKLEELREKALDAYDRLPKPVLLQCSAGIDRSAPVAAYIWKKRSA